MSSDKLERYFSFWEKASLWFIGAFILSGACDLIFTESPDKYTPWILLMIPNLIYLPILLIRELARMITYAFQNKKVLLPSPLLFYSWVISVAANDIWLMVHQNFDSNVWLKVWWYVAMTLLFYYKYLPLLGYHNDPEHEGIKQSIISCSGSKREARIKWTFKFNELWDKRKKELNIL